MSKRTYLLQHHTEKGFCIISDDCLSSEIICFFNLYSCDSISKTKTPDTEYITIVINKFGGSYLVSCENKQVQTDRPIQTLQNIIFEKTFYKSGVLPLHAGAVEMNGKAFIFMAATGVGKTTLIAYLSNRGFSYINDDHVIVDTDSLCVLPDKSPIHLRPGSLSILHNYGCDIEGKEINVEKICRVLYLPEKITLEELPISGLFFIKRSEYQNSCESVTKVDAVQLIMQNLLRYSSNGAEVLTCAIKLADKCRKLTYCDIRYISGILEKESVSNGL